MTDPYAKALKRIELLKQELAEAEEFVRLYQKFSGPLEDDDGPSVIPGQVSSDLDKPVDRSVDIGGSWQRLGPVSPHLLQHRRRKTVTTAIVRLVAEILENVGRPLTRTELVSALTHRDIALPSSDPGRYVGTILWRNRDKFRNLPGHGYWLKDRPFAPAEYDPATDSPMREALDTEADIIEPLGGEGADDGADEAEKARMISMLPKDDIFG